jgi:hypothetical protein
MRKIGFFKAFIMVAFLGFSSSAYAKSDVEVRDILFGNYSEYYSYSKAKIVDIYAFNFYDWVGKSYAQKHDIDENKMLDRARKGAKDFSIGYSGSYLPVVFGKKYNPKDYFIIIDHYNVKFMESDYRYSSMISGNMIIFKK